MPGSAVPRAARPLRRRAPSAPPDYTSQGSTRERPRTTLPRGRAREPEDYTSQGAAQEKPRPTPPRSDTGASGSRREEEILDA